MEPKETFSTPPERQLSSSNLPGPTSYGIGQTSRARGETLQVFEKLIGHDEIVALSRPE